MSPKAHLITATGIVVSLVAYGVLSGNIPTKNLALADSARIVSLFYDGQKKVVTTEATTVGDALRRAGIGLGPDDIVEPAAATTIPSGFFNINVYRARPVLLIDGSRSITTHSALVSPKLVAQSAGITVYPEDRYDVEVVTNFVNDGIVGEKITVVRAKPLTVLVDGKRLELRSQGPKVSDMLAEKHISLGEKDTVVPSLDTLVTPGMKITITRVADVVVTKDEVLAFATHTVKDNNQPRGYQKVTTEGVDGKRRVTYHIYYINGVESRRQTVAVEGQVEPITKVLVVGTKVFYTNEVVNLGQTIAAERGWTDDQWDALYTLWMHESGWSPYSQNASSGACGIPQAYPCSKLPGFSPTSPSAQISWGLNYIANRYGNPVAAWAHWQNYHSY